MVGKFSFRSWITAIKQIYLFQMVPTTTGFRSKPLRLKKTIAFEKDHIVHNAWKGSDVNYVVYFVRNGGWGIVAPAFSESKRKLIHDEHQKFEKNAKSFLKAFHLV